MAQKTLPVLLNKARVCERLQISARVLENRITAGDFPPPLRIGRQVYWSAASVAPFFVKREPTCKPGSAK